MRMSTSLLTCFLLSLNAIAAELPKTRFTPLEPDGTPSEAGKVFEWEKPTCTLGKDNKQLTIVLKGKEIKDGKFEIKLIDFDAANVEAEEAFLTDQNNAKWEADPLRDRNSRCETRVMNKAFDGVKLEKADLYVRCLRMFPIEGKDGGLKGYETAVGNPIACVVTPAT